MNIQLCPCSCKRSVQWSDQSDRRVSGVPPVNNSIVCVAHRVLKMQKCGMVETGYAEHFQSLYYR